MQAKRYGRDQQQCCVKAKKLHQGYHKAKEANSRSGDAPQTHQFHNNLYAILAGDHISTPDITVDTLEDLTTETPSVNSKEEDEKDVGRDAAGDSSHVTSQDLFKTPP